MRFFSGSSKAPKEPLGGSSLEDWASFLENSHGGITNLQSLAYLWGRIAATLHILLGSVVVYIFLTACLTVLVFGFTRLTIAEIWRRDSGASLTGASRLGKDSAGSKGRRQFFSRHRP